jgi:rhodanese-related sulfurtransferase
MKKLINSWIIVGLLCATLGMAPFFPEPHILGKYRWIDGGAIHMQPIDWWDFLVHLSPFILLGRLVFYRILYFFEKFTKMKYLQIFVFACFFGGFLSSANAQTNTAKTSVEAFDVLLKSVGETQLIDVRTPSEFEAGHIEAAQNMNFNGKDFQKQLETLDKLQDVFVYCAVGGRSSKASEMMKQLGFTKIHELQGGINAWKAAGKVVVK